MNFKYTLDKSSKKFPCPSCGKKTFVKFLDTESKSYLSENIGRCDRESNCGYFSSPHSNKPLFAISKYTPPSTPTFHDELVIDIYCNNYDNNYFIQFLLQHFPEENVIHAIEKYFIGTCNHWKGATIFYQIDSALKICGAKVMLYDCNTGKRVKKPFPHINWLHSVLRLENFVLQQSLFGLHLVNNLDIENTICLVESEKTAIIMSIHFPHYVWLATGSKQNLKLKFLEPIKAYKIIAFPDKSEFKDWNTKVDLLAKNGFGISCSSLLENKNIENGADLVDLVF